MAPAQNLLIEHLPRADRQRLLARCEPVPLVLGRLADAIGIADAYGLVAVLLICVFLIILFAGKSRLP